MTARSTASDIGAIEVEAAAWIAQLNSDRFADADKVALREWCARSQAHREALNRLGGIWAELDALAVLPAELPVAHRPRDSRARLRWNPFWVAHSAALALVVIGSTVWVGYASLQRYRDAAVGFYATSIGEQKTVVLADESTIRLNTNTFVEVDYGPGERRLRLVKGEALFTVAKRASWPFVVHAAANTVRALGTQFSVRLLQDNVEVLVTEGEVALTRSIVESQPRGAGVGTSVLGQKQTAVIDDRAAIPIEIATVPTTEIHRRLSWTTGVLEFNGEPLEKVVAEVGRYTPLHIRIAQPALRQLPVGGRFRVGETQALFDVIEAGFGAKVIYDADGVLITMDPARAGNSDPQERGRKTN